jgi:hypothetical protein
MFPVQSEAMEVSVDPSFVAECTDILLGLPDNHKFLSWTIKSRNVSRKEMFVLLR